MILRSLRHVRRATSVLKDIAGHLAGAAVGIGFGFTMGSVAIVSQLCQVLSPCHDRLTGAHRHEFEFSHLRADTAER